MTLISFLTSQPTANESLHSCHMHAGRQAGSVCGLMTIIFFLFLPGDAELPSHSPVIFAAVLGIGGHLGDWPVGSHRRSIGRLSILAMELLSD